MAARTQTPGAERPNLVRVPAGEPREGMYVAELDRPWLETPFLFQGFRITDAEELARVRAHCEWALVPEDEAPPPARKEAADADAAPAQAPVADEGQSIFNTGRSKPRPAQRPVEDELEFAEPAHQKLQNVVHDVFETARAGRTLDVTHLESAALPVIDSVGRNPDAMIWLSRLRSRDDYTCEHAVCCAVLAAGLGRHLGLARPALEALTLGVLVMDVGKTSLPEALLDRSAPFGEKQRLALREHVDAGVRLLSGGGRLGRDVLAIVAGHHERRDGSGYPQALKGERIPAYARIAGLVDTYDAMITHRGYLPRFSPHDALLELSRQRDRGFDAALVEQFVQSIGIYPTGSLVELTSGEVGIVIEQNRVRRLRPKVMLVLDADKNPLRSFRTIDLMVENDLQGEQTLQIRAPLVPGAFGVDPEEFYL